MHPQPRIDDRGCGVRPHPRRATGVVNRPRPRPEIGNQIVIALHRRPRPQLLGHPRGKGRLCRDGAQEFHGRQHLLDIILGRKGIGRNGRMAESIRRLDPDMPPAGRPAIRQPDRHPAEWVGRQQGPLTPLRDQRRKGLEIQLHVGAVQIGPRAEKAAAMVDRLGQRPAAGQEILRPHEQLAPPRSQDVIVGRRVRGPGIVDALMVVQMVPDIRIVAHHANPQALQQRPRPNARQLQQLW